MEVKNGTDRTGEAVPKSLFLRTLIPHNFLNKVLLKAPNDTKITKTILNYKKRPSPTYASKDEDV